MGAPAWILMGAMQDGSCPYVFVIFRVTLLSSFVVGIYLTSGI
jgi:hypothetical protein